MARKTCVFMELSRFTRKNKHVKSRKELDNEAEAVGTFLGDEERSW